jgi:hypothetical protein
VIEGRRRRMAPSVRLRHEKGHKWRRMGREGPIGICGGASRPRDL